MIERQPSRVPEPINDIGLIRAAHLNYLQPLAVTAVSRMFVPPLLFLRRETLTFGGLENIPTDDSLALYAITHRGYDDIGYSGKGIVDNGGRAAQYLFKAELNTKSYKPEPDSDEPKHKVIETFVHNVFAHALMTLGGVPLARPPKRIIDQPYTLSRIHYAGTHKMSLAMFPEGTREKDINNIRTVNELHPLVGLVALAYGYSIIPVAVTGTHKDDKRPPHVEYGPAIDVEQDYFSLSDIKAINDRKRKVVVPYIMPILSAEMQRVLNIADKVSDRNQATLATYIKQARIL